MERQLNRGIDLENSTDAELLDEIEKITSGEVVHAEHSRVYRVFMTREFGTTCSGRAEDLKTKLKEWQEVLQQEYISGKKLDSNRFRAKSLREYAQGKNDK